MNLVELRPLAEKLFADVRELSFDGVGVTRESYGPGETKKETEISGLLALAASLLALLSAGLSVLWFNRIL